MAFLAMTEATTNWLLPKANLVDELFRLFVVEPLLADLRSREFVEGSIRLSASSDGSVIAFWNVDYTAAAGDNAWGFIDLDAIAAAPSINREVFERAIYVLNQRLHGLLIDGAFIHRSHSNGTHTCLAGRGNDARQMSIGYMEGNAKSGATAIHSIVATGPQKDLTKLANNVRQVGDTLSALVDVARTLTDPARHKATLPATALPKLRDLLQNIFGTPAAGSEFGQVNIPTKVTIPARSAHMTVGWTYDQWMQPDSPLSQTQRSLLTSDAIYQHPVRIIGPGGSGKTLLMQLLTLRSIDRAAAENRPLRILYLAHNSKMVEMVRNRFEMLRGGNPQLSDTDVRKIEISTLSEYGRLQLQLEDAQVIDPDAFEAKLFQLETLRDCLTSVVESHPEEVNKSRLFREVMGNTVLQNALVRLLMSEISIAIKGHGLMKDRNRYVQSEKPLSRLHSALPIQERDIVFTVFSEYHHRMFDEYRVLDSDDLALSLLGRLRTPVWEMKRDELGYDHVFIDEMQLFNENERRIFALLVKSTSSYVPVVFALDEAQDIYGQVTSGMATLGIENVLNESLSSIHRSSKDIIRLAFFVIQRSTDLFGPDFPDFTKSSIELPEDVNERCKPPRFERQTDPNQSIGRFVKRRISELRSDNMQRVAVVCLAEQYWNPILTELRASELPLHILENRGQRLGTSEGVVVLSRPAHIGGQEFDAVIVVGAENGLSPPRVNDNEALAVAVEQQALRELYLSITRAKFQVMFLLTRNATPTGILSEAQASGFISAG